MQRIVCPAPHQKNDLNGPHPPGPHGHAQFITGPSSQPILRALGDPPLTTTHQAPTLAPPWVKGGWTSRLAGGSHLWMRLTWSRAPPGNTVPGKNRTVMSLTLPGPQSGHGTPLVTSETKRLDMQPGGWPCPSRSAISPGCAGTLEVSLPTPPPPVVTQGSVQHSPLDKLFIIRTLRGLL